MGLAASESSMESPSGGDQPPRLLPAERAGSEVATGAPATSGPGGGPSDAGKIVEALKSSADTEFHIAERLASKARQAYALAAGVFVISQTVAFGSFQSANLSSREQHRIIGLAIAAVLILGVATWKVLAADDVQESGDLPLDSLMDDLNKAYEGDDGVLGRLGGYYAGVVRTRRTANTVRRRAYKSSRIFVAASLAATVAELVFALIARTS